jgi:hypothetical protein
VASEIGVVRVSEAWEWGFKMSAQLSARGP